ncbi:MAG: helix-turn-helix transcriptional regulator [Selenomonas sp.]|nr:helix-turn-helix transcriptional regulator [Selenomonas sp.]
MFKDNLRNYRRAANMSQKELGEKLNVVQGTIASWEKGRNEPSIAMLIQLADIFDCTLDELVGHTEISQEVRESSSLLYELRQLTSEERNLITQMIAEAKRKPT